MKAQIVLQHGNRMIRMGETDYLPAMYRSFRPTPSNIALFHRAGVRLFQMLVSGRNSTLGLPYNNFGDVWVGEGRYDFAPLNRQMEMFRRFAPQGRFMVVVQLDMPGWWLAAHPEHLDSYRHIAQCSLNKAWRAAAAEYLRALLQYAEQHYSDWVFGYGITGGMSNEWFDVGFYGEEAEEALWAEYRRSTGDAYALLPTRDTLRATQSLRAPGENGVRWFDFGAALTPELIGFFCDAAQQVLRHEKLLGLFYGYTDCPNGENDWQNRTLTNGYEALWRAGDFDMLFSPAAYREARALQGASTYQYQVDSVALNGKWYLHENDHRTYLSDYPLDNFARIGGAMKDSFETIMVLRRELCAALCKDGAYWWFDFMGNYYASPELERELAHQLEIHRALMQRQGGSVAQVAVLVDPMSFHLLNEAQQMPGELVRMNRNALHLCGVPYDYYNFADLPHLPVSQYQVFIFLNVVRGEESVWAQAEVLLRGKRKIYLYAPHAAQRGTLSRTHVEYQLGMALAEMDPATTHTLSAFGERFGFSHPTSPLYCIEDEGAEALGRFEDGSVGLAEKGENTFIATGAVPPGVWRTLLVREGIFLYAQAEGTVYADRRFVAFQPHADGEVTLRLPFVGSAVEMFESIPCTTAEGEVRFCAQANHVYLFMEGEE